MLEFAAMMRRFALLLPAALVGVLSLVFVLRGLEGTPRPFSAQAVPAACSDGIDNDNDGLIDYPADPGCTSPDDATENAGVAECQDGIDNDGDGKKDFSTYLQTRDPDCISAIDRTEQCKGFRIAWTEAGSDALPFPIAGHASLVFDNKMWIIGGGGNAGRKVFYSSDGATWTEAGSDALPVALSYSTSVVFDNKMWVIGGKLAGAAGPSRKVFSSSDGMVWTEAGTDALPMGLFGLSAVVFHDEMWVVGGKTVVTNVNGFTSTQATRKVFHSSDGITWTEAGNDALPGAGPEVHAVVFNNQMWALYGSGPASIFWSNDGAHWDKLLSVIPNNYYYETVNVFEGRLWNIAGFWGAGYETVSMDGVAWKAIAETGRPADLWYPTSLVFDGKIWLIGGLNQTQSSYRKVLYATITNRCSPVASSSSSSSSVAIASSSSSSSDAVIVASSSSSSLPRGDLAVTVTGPSTITADTTALYTITVSNVGSTDILPPPTYIVINNTPPQDFDLTTSDPSCVRTTNGVQTFLRCTPFSTSLFHPGESRPFVIGIIAKTGSATPRWCPIVSNPLTLGYIVKQQPTSYAFTPEATYYDTNTLDNTIERFVHVGCPGSSSSSSRSSSSLSSASSSVVIAPSSSSSSSIVIASSSSRSSSSSVVVASSSVAACNPVLCQAPSSNCQYLHPVLTNGCRTGCGPLTCTSSSSSVASSSSSSSVPPASSSHSSSSSVHVVSSSSSSVPLPGSSSSSSSISVTSSSSIAVSWNPVCGNAVQEGSEQCEVDIPCASGYACESCQCVAVVDPFADSPSPVDVPVPPSDSVSSTASSAKASSSVSFFSLPHSSAAPFNPAAPLPVFVGSPFVGQPVTADRSVPAAVPPSGPSAPVRAFSSSIAPISAFSSSAAAAPSFFPASSSSHFSSHTSSLSLSLVFIDRCGDGVATGAEQCDQGPQNSDTIANRCRTDCTSPRCGDGVQDTGEQCDDGNLADGDGCDHLCQIELAATPSPSVLGSQQERSGVHAAPTIVTVPQPQYIAQAFTQPMIYQATLGSSASLGKSGPETVIVMVSGAAAGFAYLRRKRGSKKQ
jgi:cysteine-rich repeat protein